jgi:mRNA-decapping enzyme 1B
MSGDKNATNLSVLQRHDPSVVDVLFSAAHVTLYQFNEETSLWQKLNVEGSLFVVRRTIEPHHQYIVMNRRSTENYVEDISSPKFAIQDQDPYLMYRNAADQIIGIWFYDANERVAVAKLLRDITDSYKLKASAAAAAAAAAAASVVIAPPQVPVVVPGQRINIAALMMAAAVSPVGTTKAEPSTSSSTAAAATPQAVSDVGVPTATSFAATTAAAAPTSMSSSTAARDRLRTRLQALVDDDSFLDTVLAILTSSKAAAGGGTTK